MLSSIQKTPRCLALSKANQVGRRAINGSESSDLFFDKYYSSPEVFINSSKTKRDVIIIGGGHNGLVTAAYLAKKGLDVLVLERRHRIGGAAVTEEIYPGFKYSRASYLAGLLRPQIIKDLELDKYGFKYLSRNPSSFTPTLLKSTHGGKYLILGSNENANYQSIAQFSKNDADAYSEYEKFLGKVRDIFQPILDGPPPDLTQGKLKEKLRTLRSVKDLMSIGFKHREILLPFYELMVGPATTILDRWFESDILKTTLATDAVIGAMTSPSQAGSAYVLLHHVMGESDGRQGVWAYVKGGMGSISEAIASSAKSSGAEIITNASVNEIIIDKNTRHTTGVKMIDGTVFNANTVISGASPRHAIVDLIGSHNPNYEEFVPKDFYTHIKNADFSCGAFKVNMAVDKLPNFTCYPSPDNDLPGPMHFGTIHFESSMSEIESAYKDTLAGRPASRPVIEMTIPSSLDATLAPPGKHVVQLFIQFAPYDLDPSIGSWEDEKFKQAFVDRCIDIIEEYCPGFKRSILHMDVLSPLDLERVFGLYKGNIFHGSLGLHQLGYMRPAPGYSSHRSPVKGLYFCSSGTHPGGGVMGAPGRNCAMVVQSDLGL